MALMAVLSGWQREKIIAKDIAAYLEISPNWNAEIKETNHFNYLRAALDRAGVTTISGSYVKSNTHRPLNPAEFRAFALADEFAPFIFVNTNRPPRK